MNASGRCTDHTSDAISIEINYTDLAAYLIVILLI